jgi:hypothetical protein
MSAFRENRCSSIRGSLVKWGWYFICTNKNQTRCKAFSVETQNQIPCRCTHLRSFCTLADRRQIQPVPFVQRHYYSLTLGFEVTGCGVIPNKVRNDSCPSSLQRKPSYDVSQFYKHVLHPSLMNLISLVTYSSCFSTPLPPYWVLVELTLWTIDCIFPMLLFLTRLLH